MATLRGQQIIKELLSKGWTTVEPTPGPDGEIRCGDPGLKDPFTGEICTPARAEEIQKERDAK